MANLRVHSYSITHRLFLPLLKKSREKLSFPFDTGGVSDEFFNDICPVIGYRKIFEKYDLELCTDNLFIALLVDMLQSTLLPVILRKPKVDDESNFYLTKDASRAIIARVSMTAFSLISFGNHDG